MICPRSKKIKQTAYNTCYTKEAVRYSAETFVVKQTFVLRINFSANNRLLRIAPYVSSIQLTGIIPNSTVSQMTLPEKTDRSRPVKMAAIPKDFPLPYRPGDPLLFFHLRRVHSTRQDQHQN